jgi:hypothetical protein
MGRAMLILAAGATIVFGMVKLGLMGQKEVLYTEVANNATDNQVKNAAYTVVQLAMEEINQDPDWEKTKASPWEQNIGGIDVVFYYDVIGVGATSLDNDTIRVNSRGILYDADGVTIISQDSIISTFTKRAEHFVPEFKSALSFATNQFTFSASGNATISGNDASETCSDKPAITVQNEESAEEILGPDGILGSVTGDDNTEHMESSVENVRIDPSISYSPVDQLIARLAGMPGTQSISGNYKGSLGTADNPGVFFVENYAKLTGGLDAGYGIMVIRSGGELAYEGELSVAGNFEFNGLIVFENAFDFKGRGTPDLKGSVLVGTTDGFEQDIRVDLGGNINIQYDCSAEKHAQKASAELLKQNRYKRLYTFE